MNAPTSKTRVLIVDDSLIAIRIMMQILAKAEDIEIVGTARDGKQALKMIANLNPTVVCTDLHMPEMDGLELVENIMANYPRPVLVVSVSAKEGSTNVFKLLEAGALDVIIKPRLEQANAYASIANELLHKIRVLAGVKVFRKRKNNLTPIVATSNTTPTKPNSHYRIVVIGASTGGPQALCAVLSKLPHDYALPIVCVQHISDGFLKNLVTWLDDNSSLKCRIAQAGEYPTAGNVYFPQERMQLKFDEQGRFLIAPGAPYRGHCPSVSVTMQAAAKVYGANIVAVLLTGMGDDGAEGMQAITQAGGITIAQDETSCVVFGMPKQAIEIGAAKRVLSLDDIPMNLIGLCQKAI